MQKTLKTWNDPIVWVNEMLNDYGYLRQFKNNPISFYIHLFYALGNGNFFVEVNGESILGYESWDEELPDEKSEKTNLYSVLALSEELLETLKKHKATEKQIETIETQIRELKYEIELKENKTTVKDINDLKTFNVDTENVYWKNLEKIASPNSIAAKLPENISKEWKEAFRVVEETLAEADPAKMEEAKNGLKRFK